MPAMTFEKISSEQTPDPSQATTVVPAKTHRGVLTQIIDGLAEKRLTRATRKALDATDPSGRS